MRAFTVVATFVLLALRWLIICLDSYNPIGTDYSCTQPYKTNYECLLTNADHFCCRSQHQHRIPKQTTKVEVPQPLRH